MPKEGDLRVWWIPQIPMSPVHVPVESVEQGRWLEGVLAAYDMFQFEHNIKPDYSNVGGLQRFEDGDGSGEMDWWEIDDDA